MARGPSTFKQQDVTRAIKGTVAAGIDIADIARVEIGTNGKIAVVTSRGKKTEENDEMLKIEVKSDIIL